MTNRRTDSNRPEAGLSAIVEAALDQPAVLRDQFVADACAGNDDLRREVESLLSAHTAASRVFREPAIEQAARAVMPVAAGPALLIGQTIGPYRIGERLGAGGMGEVYRATDATLKREVALKVLPPAVAALPARMARFQREAEMLAALNHLNIAYVYGLAVSDGVTALVMELVEGQDLSERIAARALSVDEALGIAEQIARALEAAHEHGIIHRDLKPGNVRVRADGTVKVLDFGLARSLGADSNALPPVTAISIPGAIMGTPAYMSPEQARGEDAGRETDVWAFGVVLYEMLTGVSPFARSTPTDTLAQVLTATIDESLLPRAISGSVRRLIRRCLERDPARRWRHVGDVRIEIEEARAAATSPPGAAAPMRVPRRRIRRYAAASLMAAIAAGVGAWVFKPASPGSPGRFEVPLPEGLSATDLSVSPDGGKLVFAAAQSGLWCRRLDVLDWKLLPGTRGAGTPFWSPDSRHVGFGVADKLMRVDTTGGPPETVATVPAAALRSGAWNRDGEIVLGSWAGGSGGPMWRVPAAGGTVTPVTEVDLSRGEFVHTWPSFLPNGQSFLYFRSGPADVAGMYVGRLDVAAGQQSRQRILATGVPALYTNGHVFFVRAGTLMAQPFHPGRLELSGEPVLVAEHVGTTWYSTGSFSVSDAGVLVYRVAPTPGGFQPTWLDRQGRSVSTVAPPGTDRRVVLSPDGKRAVAKDAPFNVPGDLWMLDLTSGVRTRFTFNKNVYSPAVWSHDGARVAYAAGRLGDTIYEKPASGLGAEQVLLAEPGLRHVPTSWSRDGRFLLYHVENTPNTGYDQWALSLVDRKPHLILGQAFNEWAGVFSPDMRWVAYVSTETGWNDVFVRPFRASEQTGRPSLGEGKWQVSKDGGNWPQWRIDREIIFNTAPSRRDFFAVPVNTTGAAFESGVPRRLPFPPNAGGDTTPQSTSDGQRFLVEVSLDQQAARPAISVLLNWPGLLRP